MRLESLMLLYNVICISISTRWVEGRKLSMKVVKEPTSYGMNFGAQEQPANQASLKTRVTPSGFSGPNHLRQLVGKCYSKMTSDYKFKLCPFDNVTQHEQTLRWNPFNGILGVWQQWMIENNSFVAMMMQDGDPCGNLFRSTKVKLGCGNKTEIESITEPETCSYLLQFNTPLVCDPRSLLVYPTLPIDLQDDWDLLEGFLVQGDITQKGYDQQLNSIFIKAGYLLSSKQKQTQIILKKEAERRNKIEEGNFDSLAECQAEYRRLHAQVKEQQAIVGNTTENITTDGTVTV